MAAHYRVKEHRATFTPQRKVFGIWLKLGPPQPTMEAANLVIKARIRSKHGGILPHRPVETPRGRG